MPNYTLPKVYTNKERQQISIENTSNVSDHYTSSDDSDRISNKKHMAIKLVTVTKHRQPL